jgi:hypothetical protein
MKFYSSIDKFVVPCGIRFPHRPADGRLFYRTDIEELFIHVDSKWTSVSGSNLDISIIPEQIKVHTSTKFASIDQQLKSLASQKPKDQPPVVVNSPAGVQLEITNVFEKGQRVAGGIYKDGTGPGAEIEYKQNTAMFSGYDRTTSKTIPVKIQGSSVLVCADNPQLEITNKGVDVKQTFRVGSVLFDGNATDSLQITTKHGTLDIGPKNKKYCNFETSATAFHFNAPIHTSADVKKFTGGIGKPYIYLDNETQSSSIVISAEQPPGDWTRVEEIFVDKGRIWFKI